MGGLQEREVGRPITDFLRRELLLVAIGLLVVGFWFRLYPNFFDQREFLSGLLAGSGISVLLTEIIYAYDRRDAYENNRHLLQPQRKTYQHACELGERFFILSRERERNSTRATRDAQEQATLAEWQGSFVDLAHRLQIDSAVQPSMTLLGNSSHDIQGDVSRAEEIVGNELKQQSYIAWAAFEVGIDLMLLTTLAERGTSMPESRVQNFLFLLRTFATDARVVACAGKSFRNANSTSMGRKQQMLFLDLLDHYVRFLGEPAPNVLRLERFLSRHSLPMTSMKRRSFTVEAERLLQTFGVDSTEQET